MVATAIDRRGNGRYRARYRAPDGRWRSKTFDRKTDARRWLTNEVSMLTRGDWVDPRAGEVPFEVVAERWMAGRVALRPSTRARDRSYLRSLILPRFGIIPIGAIQPSDLDAWIADLIDQGKAPATIHKAWQIVGGVFRLAARDRLIPLSPATDAELPDIPHPEPEALTLDEVVRLADAIDPRYQSLVLVGAFGGLRIGELAGLQVRDFNSADGHLRIRRGITDVRGQTVVGPPKTAKSIRTVAIPGTISRYLAAHIAGLDSSGLDDWIFPSPEGGPIRYTNWVRRFWKPALTAAELPDHLGTHTLRRSQVALLIAEGEHPKVIADRLGHTSVRTVLDVYGHLYEGADEAAADRLEARIRKREKDVPPPPLGLDR